LLRPSVKPTEVVVLPSPAGVGVIAVTRINFPSFLFFKVSKYSGDYSDDIIETLNLDGLFIAAHKQRIKVNFNENIKGFHFYDVDFTFNNHLNNVKIGVIII